MLEKVDEGVVLARHLERAALNNVAAIWPNVEIGSVASLFCFSLRFANSFISPADLFFNYPTPIDYWIEPASKSYAKRSRWRSAVPQRNGNRRGRNPGEK